MASGVQEPNWRRQSGPRVADLSIALPNPPPPRLLLSTTYHPVYHPYHLSSFAAPLPLRSVVVRSLISPPNPSHISVRSPNPDADPLETCLPAPPFPHSSQLPPTSSARPTSDKATRSRLDSRALRCLSLRLLLPAPPFPAGMMVA